MLKCNRFDVMNVVFAHKFSSFFIYFSILRIIFAILFVLLFCKLEVIDGVSLSIVI